MSKSSKWKTARAVAAAWIASTAVGIAGMGCAGSGASVSEIPAEPTATVVAASSTEVGAPTASTTAPVVGPSSSAKVVELVPQPRASSSPTASPPKGIQVPPTTGSGGEDPEDPFGGLGHTPKTYGPFDCREMPLRACCDAMTPSCERCKQDASDELSQWRRACGKQF